MTRRTGHPDTPVVQDRSPSRVGVRSPLSLLIGADSLTTRRSGIGRVTFELAQRLRASPDIALVRLWAGERFETADLLDRIARQQPLGPGRSVEERVAHVSPLRAAVARVPGVAPLRNAVRRSGTRREMAAFRREGAGRLLYFEPNMITRPFDGVMVAQVHDLSWLHHRDLHPAERLAWIDRNIGRTLRDTARFAAISRFTAEGFARAFDVSPARIDVVPNAASEMFWPRPEADAVAALARHGLVDRSYILSVSTLEPRKNFDRLLDAHHRLSEAERQRFPLAIAGGAGWGSTLASPRAERARREGTLRLLGYLADDELADITARAACFAYVSLYEGFGLPVLEAMASGTPVVASSTTAVGETAGDAALLVDPEDVDGIADGIRQVIADKDLADRLTERGLARAGCFSWGRTAEAMLDTFARALP